MTQRGRCRVADRVRRSSCIDRWPRSARVHCRIVGWLATRRDVAHRSHRDRTYSAALDLPPGVYPYKFIVDGAWILDPSHKVRAYEGGVENSALRVLDCRDPLLRVVGDRLELNGPSRGSAVFSFEYTEASDGRGPDPAGFELELASTGTSARTLDGAEWTWDESRWSLVVSLVIRDGSTRSARAKNVGGKAEPGAVTVLGRRSPRLARWRPLHDRHRSLSGRRSSNNPAPMAQAASSADFSGGDLERAPFDESYFDAWCARAVAHTVQ